MTLSLVELGNKKTARGDGIDLLWGETGRLKKKEKPWSPPFIF
jgi:hypothetical protein